MFADGSKRTLDGTGATALFLIVDAAVRAAFAKYSAALDAIAAGTATTVAAIDILLA